MSPAPPNQPKIGIPWRTSKEEAEQNLPKLKYYLESIRAAGGEPVVLPLSIPPQLANLLPTVDGFVLPGSPADVAPEQYGTVNQGHSAPADPPRENTDWAILRYAFEHKKPVLAICYGCQSLNVYSGGTLIQDLRAETRTTLPHRKQDLVTEIPEGPMHPVRFEPASRLARLAGAEEAVVNSEHHQSVKNPGRQLKVTAHAPDGVVESVEWVGDENWVTGVQWHPERMRDDALAASLFSELVAHARSARPLPADR